jgi:aminoglycoside 3-N-acetyltransferase
MTSFSFNDMNNAIQSIGVKRGNLLMTHIAFDKIGIPVEKGENKSIKSIKLILEEMLFDLVGETGTLLVPAFSYSFTGEKEKFDPKTTPSKVGGFSNYLIRQGRWKRSMDPLFSMLGSGPLVNELFANLPHTSFGHDCLFARALQHDVKVCYLGIGNIVTAFHHFEYLHNVPYRFDKNFSGTVVTENNEEEQTWTYFVRVFDSRTVSCVDHFEKDLLKQGIMKRVFIGNSHISVFNLKDYFDTARIYLERDIFTFIQEPIPLDELKRLIQDDLEKTQGMKNK